MGSKLTCLSKAIFYSEFSAQLRADELNLNQGYEKFSIYKCNCCHFYHLTTQKKE